MPGLHFVTMAGADNRAELLRGTFQLVKPYFDSLHFLDTGSTDDTPSLEREFDLTYIRYPKLDNKDWGPTIKQSFSRVPDGDWFVFMDSDERPSQNMLDRLRSDIQTCLDNGTTQGRYFGVHHMEGPPTHKPKNQISDFLNPFLNLQPMVNGTPEVFTKAALNLKGNNEVPSWGPHFGIGALNNRYTWFPSFYNHVKTTRQTVESWIICSYPLLYTHGGVKNSTEHKQLVALANKYNMPTGQELIKAARTNSIPQEMMDLFASWKDSAYEICRYYNTWAYEYKFDARDTLPRCGDVCCLYANGLQL